MDNKLLSEYAELIVALGVNVQVGQEVIIRAELDQPEFIRMLTKTCYEHGASNVTVRWEDQQLTRMNYEYKTESDLGKVEKWEEVRLEHEAEILPARIYIESEDPDGLDGIDTVKYANAIAMRYRIIKPIRDRMENKYQWCIAAVPGKKWAEKTFPGYENAEEMLWEAILNASRVTGNAVEQWNMHNKKLHERCDYLNALKLRKLIYKSSNGTDFSVELIPDALFCAGSEKLQDKDIWYNANIPSEEVFTSPMAGKAEGIVYSTRPLCYRGMVIESFCFEFKDGKVSNISASNNEDVLRKMVETDEGSCMLGECALVPYENPIRKSKCRLFYNTLFDENAACHLALGDGFTSCIKDYEKYSMEECRKKGINDSMIHEDFMIGSEDMDITGITENGDRVKIFENGNWAF